jgi:hypothetical protein
MSPLLIVQYGIALFFAGLLIAIPFAVLASIGMTNYRVKMEMRIEEYNRTKGNENG